MRIPRNRRRRAAALDLLVLSFVAQLTAEVLSQKEQMCMYVRSETRHSSASQFRTIPANSRSLIEMVPVSNEAMISVGHRTFQIVGGMCWRPEVHAPPEPSRQLSEYPTYVGRFETSWSTHVGFPRMCLMMAPQSLKASVSRGVTRIQSDDVVRASCREENRLAPPGSANEACCSLPAIDSMTFRGIFRLNLRTLLRRSRMLSHLSSGSLMVKVLPQKIQPRISFW